MQSTENKRLPILCDDSLCTGCAACANICSFNAITMSPNAEGFYRPEVTPEMCIGCTKCERICPVLNPLPVNASTDQKVYAGWNKDSTVRSMSSSGGAFSALAQTVLEMNGIVYGAAFDENLHVAHIRIDKLNDLDKLRLSKYVQSEINKIFKEVQIDIHAGRSVLFCGTPCQAAGLRAFLQKPSANLVICDFICHGVPSPLMLKKYVQWLAPWYGTIKHINFRDKRKGWYDALRVITNDKGEKSILRGHKDSYWVAFNNNNNLQACCYDCRFLGRERRSDITIADFWGIGKSTPFGYKNEIEKGVSAIIVNTSTGLDLLNKSDSKMEIFERTIEEVESRNKAMIYPSPMPPSRKKFYLDLRSMTYNEMIHQYLIPNNKTKLVKFMREYMPFSILNHIRTIDQK